MNQKNNLAGGNNTETIGCRLAREIDELAYNPAFADIHAAIAVRIWRQLQIRRKEAPTFSLK
jgi:hypothetical protein